MDILRPPRWALACVLAAATIAATSARAAPPPGPAVDGPRPAPDPGMPPYFVILDAPGDFNALLQKIRRPDVEIRAADRQRPAADAPGPGAATPPAVVESVRIRGRVRGDSAAIRVALAIATSAEETTWVPIRLDGQRLADAREGARTLDLKMVAGRWQVGLAGRGRHRVEVDLRCPLTTGPARASLSMAIPEAPSTAMELDFDRREPDLIVGAGEVYAQADLPDGRGARLSARLSPRSRVDVSWAVDEEAGRRNPPLLTAQGDIAIDIDAEQMRTRSSWVIRCVRGMTRTLEVLVSDQDEVTELRVDDQQAGPSTERVRGEGRLIVPLAEPLRPGADRRLVLMTRRPRARGAGHRIVFRGFPIAHARQQSGAIGVTQSADLWVAPASSSGLRRIVPTFLPKELAERPGTSLAFEFLDQPFSLGLDVEASPPLVRARSRTAFRLEGDRARSEAAIELQWVRGRPFEVGLGLGPSLEVVSVGPPGVVEAWNLTDGPTIGGTAAAGGPRGLTIRLAPAVRDQSRVTLRLEGSQPLPREGPVELGLFAPDEATAASAAFTVAADRGLSVELDEAAAPSGRPAFRVADATPGAPVPPAADGPALAVEAGGSPRSLPLRIARHARTLRQETAISAEVSRRSVDLVQKTTLTVRHGAIAALTVRVPSALVDRWNLRDREVVDREELGSDPDGSRRYRLHFDRPIPDRAVLEFRARMPIHPALDATTPREAEVPWIAMPEAAAGATRVELLPRPGVVVRDIDPSWARASAVGAPGPGEGPGLSYVEGPTDKGHPLRFRAVAMESVPMPALLAPRLLIRSALGLDDTIRSVASYWVEAHGPTLPFALPEAARLVAARVGGRAAEQVDLEGSRDGHRLYRLRLPAEAAARPIAIELEYQHDAGAAGPAWEAPRLLDDGLVLQALWEVQLPWDRVLLGAPRGWSDENEWWWGGSLGIRRSSRGDAALARWLLGDGAPPSMIGDPQEGDPGDSQHLLFGRSAGRPGEAMAMTPWIAPRSWLVASCSGATLLVGFLAIFSGIRFRTAWALAAAVGLLAASTLRPGVAAQLLQSSVIGVVLTSLGLVIQHQIDRRRSRTTPPAREAGSGLGPPRLDASSQRAAAVVGSDDPTAIRVRTPSTLDFVPKPIAGPTESEESHGSAVGRT